MKKLFSVIFIFLLSILMFGCGTMSPLMQAIDKGDLKAAENLLDRGADINEATPCDGDMPEYESYTPLGCAAKNGRTAAAKLLLDRGADVNRKWGGYRFGYWNPPALILAAIGGHTDTAKLLLDRGADVHATDSMIGIRALTIAASGGDNPEIVKLLLDRGANVNEKSNDGTTPLIFAAGPGRAGIIKILLERGANINAKTNSGTTALSMAASQGHNDIVKILVDAGADVDAALVALESDVQSSQDAAKKTKYKQGINLLGKYVKKQEIAVPPASPVTMSKEELTNIVQAAVEGAARTQKKGTKSSLPVSDIEKPAFNADEKIMGDNDLAVIIGIEGYSNLPKSDYSYDDARLVKDYVKALGIKERNIELIMDEKATLSGIAKAIDAWLRNKARKDSRVFVYYSGHGAPDPATGDAYLVPFDGDPNYLSVTGYPLKRLYDNLGKLQVAEVTVVLDACFSGAGGRSVLAKGARPLVMTTGTISIPSNIAVLSATQGTQISTSSPEKGHGVFTYHFLKALNDGKKNLSEIYEYIKPQVEDEAKQLNVQQSPSLNPAPEKLTGRFNLRQ